MRDGEPLDRYRGVVLREWIDSNGHMNLAYYVFLFDRAYDILLDLVGLDDAYRRERGGAIFSAEGHVNYLRELKEGDPVRVTTQLLGYDAKRLHVYEEMYHADRGFLAATSEWLSLHVDLSQRRAAPMPADIAVRVAALYETHRRLPWPERAGRAIRGPQPAMS